MYVILKGKIGVKVGMQGKKDIKVLIAMPSDGDAFGELSAFDFNKIKTTESKDYEDDAASQKVQKPDVKRRAGTCVPVEETIMLRITHENARTILQTKTVTSQTPIESCCESRRQSEDSKVVARPETKHIIVNNEIGRKI